MELKYEPTSLVSMWAIYYLAIICQVPQCPRKAMGMAALNPSVSFRKTKKNAKLQITN